MFNFHSIPVVRTVALFHQALVSLPASVGGLVGEVFGRNRLPIEALLTRMHQLIVIGWAPRAGIVTLGGGWRGSGHCGRG